jgi:hypothetical protein
MTRWLSPRLFGRQSGPSFETFIVVHELRGRPLEQPAAGFHPALLFGAACEYYGGQRLSRGYQDTDAHIVDYELYRLPGVDIEFRGPALRGGGYAAFVGSAHTFGRFVQQPFPALVSHALGIDSLNLGIGGAGPAFFLCRPKLMEYINRGRIAVVQVLSGRSQSNSLFDLLDQRVLGVNLAIGQHQSADEFYTWLLRQESQLAPRIVEETKEKYVSAMTQLLDAIEPPKILFWFSVRSPGYKQSWELPLGRLWGEFPQFVDQEMVNRLRSRADVRYVECISCRGLPQPLFDRSGLPTSFATAPLAPSEAVMKTENRYYPSPEMHADAAIMLTPACREILNRQSS